MAITNYKLKGSLDLSTQKQLSLMVWDRLPTNHKNVLQTPQNVYIYNRKEESDLINSALAISLENPSLLEYYYLSQKQKRYTLELARLCNKGEILWNEEALKHIKNDKSISSKSRIKLRPEVIMLFKEGDDVETFVVFQTRGDMNLYAASLKAYLNEFKGDNGNRQKLESKSATLAYKNTNGKNAEDSMMSQISTYNLDPYSNHPKQIEKVKAGMRLFRILTDSINSTSDTAKFILHLSVTHNRDNYLVYNITVPISSYLRDSKSFMANLAEDLKPLAHVDVEMINGSIRDTMLCYSFKDKSKQVHDLLDKTHRNPNEPGKPRVSLSNIAHDLKRLQYENKEMAMDKNSELFTKLYGMMMSTKLNYIVENFETIAHLQGVNDTSFISNALAEETLKDDTRVSWRGGFINQPKDFLNSRSNKTACDCSSICQTF